jgi:hypothetical protein
MLRWRTALPADRAALCGDSRSIASPGRERTRSHIISYRTFGGIRPEPQCTSRTFVPWFCHHPRVRKPWTLRCIETAMRNSRTWARRRAPRFVLEPEVVDAWVARAAPKVELCTGLSCSTAGRLPHCKKCLSLTVNGNPTTRLLFRSTIPFPSAMMAVLGDRRPHPGHLDRRLVLQGQNFLRPWLE